MRCMCCGPRCQRCRCQCCCCRCCCFCHCHCRNCNPAPPPPPPPPEPGTEENPFLISTAEELDGLRDYLGTAGLGKYFKLKNDIDLTDFLSPGRRREYDGLGWEPIGSASASFQGNLDGDGHKITGLWIDRPDTDTIGLFGHIDQGSVKNLGVELTEEGVSGHGNVGGLAGTVSNERIENCYAIGNVAGVGHVGGLVGYADDGAGHVVNIKNCHAEGEVLAIAWAGGLVGFYSSGGVIEKCWSDSEVHADSIGVGGLLGSGSNGKIKNCYAKGAVECHDFSGGFIGWAGHYGPFEIEKCYAAGAVSGMYDIGGFAGKATDTDISGSFFDIEATGQKNGVGSGPGTGVTGKMTDEMKEKSTFTDAGWDFDHIWTIDEGYGYPYFRPKLIE